MFALQALYSKSVSRNFCLMKFLKFHMYSVATWWIGIFTVDINIVLGLAYFKLTLHNCQK